MPDLITHISAGYFFARWSRIVKCSTLFYVGTMLPDLLTRPFYIMFPALYWGVYPLHTPLALFLVCLLSSLFFSESNRQAVFISFLAGSYFHLSLDLLQKNIDSPYSLLFPFSWKGFEVGLFGPEDMMVYIPLWILAVILIEFFSKKKVFKCMLFV